MDGRPGMTTVIVNGKQVPLKLSLGALAEIEAVLGASTLVELGTRLANPSAAQLLRILGVLIEAGGAMPASDIRAASLNVREALTAVLSLFREAMEVPDLPGKPTTAPDAGASGSDSP